MESRNPFEQRRDSSTGEGNAMSRFSSWLTTEIGQSLTEAVRVFAFLMLDYAQQTTYGTDQSASLRSRKKKIGLI